VNGEGGIGRAEEDLGYLRGDFVTGIEFGTPFPGGFYPDISMGFIPVLPQAFFELPPVLYGPAAQETDTGDSATPEPEALPPSVVDPEQGTQTTVFESVPGGIYETTRAPTDWDRVYDEYVILNPTNVPTTGPEIDVPFHDSIDWGEVAGGILGGVLDPFGVGAAARAAFAPPTTVTGIPSLGQQTSLAAPTPLTAGAVMEHGCPPYGPKYGKICLATGVVTPLRRRRRRRLLTSSDIKDLSALKSIVGGAALQAAVTQAVRR